MNQWFVIVSLAHYFTGDERAFCLYEDVKENDYDTCFKCKENWLNSEVSE